MKGLFKRLSILTASLAMVFGVGLVNSEKKNAKAENENYILFDFYDENKIKSTNGTNLTSSNVLSFGKLSTGEEIDNTILSTFTPTNTVQYGKNGGLTLGGKNSTGAINFVFNEDYAITKVELIGTQYDTGTFKLNSNSAESGELNAKGTKLASATKVMIWNFSSSITTLKFETTTKRATIYQLKFYYDTVEQKVLEKLTISGTLTKKDYTNAESFDPTGLTIKAKYTNSDVEEDVTNEVEWPALTVGMTSITGTFEGETVTIDGITVSEVDTISFANDSLEVLTNSETDLSYTVTGSSEIIWASDKEAVVTVKNGKLKALSVGSATITATKGAEKATCKVLVTDHAGTEADPYSVNDAHIAIDFGKTSTAFVKGIVSEKSSLSTSYKNYDYINIVDSANDTTKFLQLYRFLDLKGQKFSKDYINKGDTIVATGTLTYYSDKEVYELAQGCYLVSRIANELSLDTMKKILKPNETFTLTATAGGEVTWLSSDSDVASVDNSGNVTAKKDGLAKITANYNGASAECVVAVISREGTLEDPYTVNDARNAIEGGSTKSAYVQGKVVSTNNYSSGSYFKVFISDDGTTTNQFVLYTFYAGVNKTKFTSDMLEKGGTILAYGSLLKYNSDYELNAGCYLVKYTPNLANCTLSITQIAAEYYKDDSGNFGYAFVDKKGNEYTNIGSKTWSSTYENVIMVDENTGEYVVMGTGSTTITLTITVNGTKYSTSIDIEVKETPAQVLFVRSVNAIGEITLDNYNSAETKKAIQDAKDYYDLIEDESVKELEEVKAAKAKLDSIVETADAYTFVGDWNSLRELGNGSICGYLQGEDYDLLKELLDRYDQMTEAQKAIIDAEKDGDTTIGNTISYIKAYLNVHGDPTSTGNKTNQNGLALNSSNNTFFVLVIGILGLASIVGYYLANKKKMLTK